MGKIKLKLDTYKRNIRNPTITIRQGDSNQQIECSLTDNLSPSDIKNSEITFYATTPNGAKVIDSNVIKTDVTKGVFVYSLPSSLGQDVGQCKNAYFEVKSDKAILTTQAIDINVIAGVDLTADEAGNYVTTASKALDDAKNEIEQKFEKVATNLDGFDSHLTAATDSLSTKASDLSGQLDDKAKQLTSELDGHIKSVGEAQHAISADHANTASHADSATNADTAKQADSATNANHADSATTADKANVAGHADTSSHADTATSAEQAGHASTADKATTADTAKRADNASSADNATHAVNADNATNAVHADSADKAKQADTAGTADRANTASHADVADMANSLKEHNFYRFDSFYTGSWTFIGAGVEVWVGVVNHSDNHIMGNLTVDGLIKNKYIQPTAWVEIKTDFGFSFFLRRIGSLVIVKSYGGYSRDINNWARLNAIIPQGYRPTEIHYAQTFVGKQPIVFGINMDGSTFNDNVYVSSGPVYLTTVYVTADDMP